MRVFQAPDGLKPQQHYSPLLFDGRFDYFKECRYGSFQPQEKLALP